MATAGKGRAIVAHAKHPILAPTSWGSHEPSVSCPATHAPAPHRSLP